MRALFSLLFVLTTCGPAFAQTPASAGVDPLETTRRELQQGNFDAAHAALDRVPENDAPKVNVFDLRGAIFLEQKKLDEALAAFTAAHEAEPNFFLPHIHLGDTYLRLGKWVEARNVYDEVVARSNVLIVHERARYGILLSYLGAKDDAGAKEALESIAFPTETASYYYAQAAWAFAHDSARAAKKWLDTAGKIFAEKDTAWFARPLHEFGWLKGKPAIVPELIQ
jgi:tetratricopeptide (TPR) repeat protein